MKQIIPILCMLGFGMRSLPQNLPLPLPVRAAREAGTRTESGLPGNYWQNRSEYTLSIKVLPDSNLLYGSGRVIYHNESRDTLPFVVLRLYQNLFASATPRQFAVNAADLHSGMVLGRLVIDGQPVNPGTDGAVSQTPTNLIVRLAKPLLPGGFTEIEMQWSFPIPSHSQVRMGRYPNGSLFIAYFYPQVAVYDDIDGWDLQEYSGLTEFYNDFSDYKLEIQAPADYPVWATGDLINKNEIYSDEILKRYTIATSSDTLVHIFGAADSLPLRNHTGLVTWQFTASRVPDVAFGLARKYCWDAVSVEVDPRTGRRSLASAVYPVGTNGYERVAEVAAATLKYLSSELPGVPYPYEHSTTFCNGRQSGGMEYPMMTNNGNPAQFANLAGLTFHEIAHTYFPFYMGINERKYAWMDEGWASLLPTELVDRIDPTYGYWAREVNAYMRNAGSEFDTPLIIPSAVLNNPAYRAASYYRPAMAYNFLRDAMGKERFVKGLKEYIRVWNGKHPIPYDFFGMMDRAAGESLNWFWKPWFFETAYPDLKIASVQLRGRTLEVEVENTGGLPLTVKLVCKDASGRVQEISKSCTCWKGNTEKMVLKLMVDEMPVEVRLGDVSIPDITPADNVWKP